MKCICANSVSLGQKAFAPLGELEWLPEGDIIRESLGAAEVLISRSKTRLDRRLLTGSKLRFVGTCTAGVDHADPAAMAELGVHFASAPGCNANAVSEYVVAVLLEAAAAIGFRFDGRTLGIVGHGQVGSRVEIKAKALGFKVLRNDPPKQAAGAPGPYVRLEEILRCADVVSLHVPLVEDGPFPTRNLLGAAEIGRLKPGAMLINACRGEVVDGTALAAARRSGALSWLAVDVWDPEPAIPADLLAAADLATPHIAGHSVEGKVNGTLQVRQALNEFLGGTLPVWDPLPLLPPPACAEIALSGGGGFEARLLPAVRACYDVREDDRALRAVPPGGMAAHFTSLRRNYRDRREFTATRLRGVPPAEQQRLQSLGFRLAPLVSR